MRPLLARLLALFHRRRLDEELADEMSAHLELSIADHLARGLSLEEARRAAALEFGGTLQTTEAYRDQQGFPRLDALGQDLRYAVRVLRKSPAFAATAVATLALAIGASTVMFSVVNAVLLRPLPYRAPEQLMMLWTDDRAQNLREGRSALSSVAQWRSQSRSFADIAVFDAVSTMLTGGDGAEQILGARVSANLLPLLGVQPAQGRSFSDEEAEQDQRVALISHRFWQARFGGSPNAIGATIVLNGQPSQIVGVLPAGFQVATLDADVWQPQTMTAGARDGDTWFVIGRLRPEVAVDRARAEMSDIAGRLNDRLPAAERNRSISVVPLSLSMVGSQSRLGLWMLGTAVLCVFLIAAANVASLSLARSVARTREMAIRVALGASGGRIVRQLLTESVLLAAVSGLMGILLASAGIRLVRAFGPADLPRLTEVNLDVRVLAWTLGLSLIAGVLVGLAPALMTWRGDMRASGEESGRVVSGPGTRRIRRALVVAEFALAIVLLVGAGLLVRSWRYVTRTDPGFRPERVLVMELSAPTAFTIPAQRSELYRRALEQVQAVPGVERAGIIGDLFIGNNREQILTVEGDGRSTFQRLPLRRDEVSDDFFKTLATPLRRGRVFSIGDGPDAPRVAIVNETMAHRSWPGRDPVGRRFKLGPPDSDRPWYTVVGVVGDMRRQGLEREPIAQMFEPLAQNPPRSVDLFVRTSSDDPLAMADTLRAALRGVEKNAPIYGVAPLERQFGTYLAQRRLQTTLLAGFSVVALLMAAIGIYGLIRYSVTTRTREIGVRMAIGAQAGDIFRLIIGEGLTLSLAGLTLGLVGALWLGEAGSSLLVGVTATDPLTFTIVSLVLTAVALVASAVPARQAMKIEPVVALRRS